MDLYKIIFSDGSTFLLEALDMIDAENKVKNKFQYTKKLDVKAVTIYWKVGSKEIIEI